MEQKVNNFKAYQDTKMKEGNRYVYELLGTKPDPDNKGMLIGSWTYISPSDTIQYNGSFYDIAMVNRYNTDGSYEPILDVSFSPANLFRLELIPGNPRHEEVYRFFSWCNDNASNPNRRADVIPKFKQINESANAKAEVEKSKAMFEAMQVFFSLKDEDVERIALTMGIPKDDIDVMKNNLRLKVESKADDFLKFAKVEPKGLDEIVKVKDAIKNGILKVNLDLGQVTFGDNDDVVFKYFGKKLKEQDLLDAIKKSHPYILEAI